MLHNPEAKGPRSAGELHKGTDLGRLLRVHPGAIATWVLAQAGIVHTPREKRVLAIAK